jgi:Ice-binding-like
MGLASTVRFSHRAPIMSIHRLRVVSLIAVAAATVACGDAPASTSPHASVASSGLLMGALYCTVTVGVRARAERSSPRGASIGCRTQAPGGVRVSTAGLVTAQHDTVLGQQGVDVLVKFDSVFLTEGEDNASEMLTLWASVENLLSQDIGTSDGSTADSAGTRVFFASCCNTSGGTGLVTLINADGIGTFVGTEESYFQYTGLLAPDSTTISRPWQFSMPTGVTQFEFTVDVEAVIETVGPPPVADLRSAAANGIMAGTAVTCVADGTINANVSISPGNTITGFGPCVITGVQHLDDAVAIQGQIDLASAYNTLVGLPCPPLNKILANLGGTTLPAGVYCSGSSIGVTGTLTLDGGGDPNASFVFQAGSTLTTAGSVVLINGAQAKNVYWQVGSSATLGTASQWQGNILALTSISLLGGTNVNGRTLARNGAVTLTSNNIITLP